MEAVREKNYKKNTSTDTMESVQSLSDNDDLKYEPPKEKRKRYNFQEKKKLYKRRKQRIGRRYAKSTKSAKVLCGNEKRRKMLLLILQQLLI